MHSRSVLASACVACVAQRTHGLSPRCKLHKQLGLCSSELKLLQIADMRPHAHVYKPVDLSPMILPTLLDRVLFLTHLIFLSQSSTSPELHASARASIVSTCSTWARLLLPLLPEEPPALLALQAWIQRT